jgi:hypothetical protein
MHVITFNTRIQVKTDAHVFFWVIERHIVIYNITPHFLSWYYYYHHLDLIFFFFFEKKKKRKERCHIIGNDTFSHGSVLSSM